jgi:serine/threonine protein kinase
MTTRDSRDDLEPTSQTDVMSLPPSASTESLASSDLVELGPSSVTPVPRPTRIEAPHARERPVAASAPRAAGADRYLGTQLGSYRVLELLGKGGMGFVYRAEHTRLGRQVALKLLRHDYARRRDAVARFFQEARTVNRVRHRNIVEVTDLVELADGTTFIIMELLTGESLGTWAKRGVDPARMIGVLGQVCDGLAAAHRVGVVHRDLKPDNVMIVEAPGGHDLVKLLDFGVAKLIHRSDEDVGDLTAAGVVIGTPAYMSAEQAGGMEVDARSDIYSLGAIMYELFCGQPMFRGHSFADYVRKHMTEVPLAPRDTPGGAQIDPALEAVIVRCVDKDPAQRFATADGLRAALVPRVNAPAPSAGPAPAERRTWLWAVVAAVLALALVAALFAV